MQSTLDPIWPFHSARKVALRLYFSAWDKVDPLTHLVFIPILRCGRRCTDMERLFFRQQIQGLTFASARIVSCCVGISAIVTTIFEESCVNYCPIWCFERDLFEIDLVWPMSQFVRQPLRCEIQLWRFCMGCKSSNWHSKRVHYIQKGTMPNFSAYN